MPHPNNLKNWDFDKNFDVESATSKTNSCFCAGLKKFILPLFTATLFSSALIAAEGTEQQSQGIEFYPNPGVVTIREGRLVGSDHLYNLSNKIGIYVEIIKTKNIVLPFDESTIQQHIADAFKKARIEPFAQSIGGKPALPVFHVLLMFQSVEKGYAIFCEGRLFEDVKLARVNFADQTLMQAITWESQNFVVVPTATLAEQANLSIDKVTNAFIERYKYFQEIYRSKKGTS